MNKIVSSCLIALVCSIIIGNIPNSVYADSQTDSLIKIATQARDQLRIQLSKIGNISEEITAQFNEGSDKIKLLREAAAQDNVSEARKHFLSAMKTFNEISKKISEYTSAQAVPTAQTSTFSNQLDRLEDYVERLKQIAAKNNVNIDFITADQLIKTARKYIEEKNYEQASSETDKVKKEIIELNNELKEKTQQYTTDRAKDFAQRHLEQLDSLIHQAQKIGVSQETIDRLLDAKANLDSATDVDQIIREIKHLISVKEEFENTKEQRIKSRVNQLENKLNQLSSYADKNTESFEKAKTMIDKLKELLNKNKLDEAITLIHSLNNLLNEIETSSSPENMKADSEGEDQLNSLADSKKERIKIKIQRLEAEMNEIAGQIEENAAAKRWLDNAFSLLEEAKIFIDESPERSLETILKIEEILSRVQKALQ